MTDPVAFRSDRLPTEHFDRRFSPDNLSFWVPLLIETARIGEGDRVLDVGCGTGGFSLAIATATPAIVTGLDISPAFIEFARKSTSEVDWLVGSAEALPVRDESFDRVLLSLVLHQLSEPATAVSEAFRVLRTGGFVVVRTIPPDAAAERVPARYFPSMAAADVARMISVETIRGWLESAGFLTVETRLVERNARLEPAREERQLLAEVAARYAFIDDAELQAGLERMRAAATAAGSEWVDRRPTAFLVGEKP